MAGPLLAGTMKFMNCLSDFYRCPGKYLRFARNELTFTSRNLSSARVAAGGTTREELAPNFATESLFDRFVDADVKNGTVYLPFDPSRAIDDLRCEKYAPDWRQSPPVSVLARMYYFTRPALPISIRKHLQKWYFRGWDKLSFPHWPVDCTVDDLHEQLLLLTIRASGHRRIPFVWFWPEGASSCAIMTHDIETTVGRDLCGMLMDVDDSYAVKSSFQVIPEQRYVTSAEFLDSIRSRGFEIVVHDLNHDGHLYRDREQFLERAAKINAYAKLYGAQGFRAGSLYRKQVWYDALDFAYDMSVPNVAHLDPQRGGCCTVMPYFLGKILELPVTTCQDYTVFNILNDDSIDLWKRQTALIMRKHGLISFIAHPDYLVSTRRRNTYEELLNYIVGLRDEKNVWVTTPGEVNCWWRQRAEMNLVEDGGGWRIEGIGRERARVAFASEDRGQLVVTLEAEPRKEHCIASVAASSDL